MLDRLILQCSISRPMGTPAQNPINQLVDRPRFWLTNLRGSDNGRCATTSTRAGSVTPSPPPVFSDLRAVADPRS